MGPQIFFTAQLQQSQKKFLPAVFASDKFYFPVCWVSPRNQETHLGLYGKPGAALGQEQVLFRCLAWGQRGSADHWKTLSVDHGNGFNNFPNHFCTI